ncbi:MAG: glycosyltransferase [Microthrixaceae bacterium]|nr:glycosyltransferase [Microthrixaceae bacterium]
MSVVVPFYRGLQELELTLAGLASQAPGGPTFDVIVAEDGSPLSPRHLARRFPGLDLRFVRIERDGFRLSTARNEALSVARSLVLLLDFDCVPTPTHVKAHVRALVSGPMCVTIGLRRFVHRRGLSPEVVASGGRWWDELDDVESISNPGSVIDKRAAEVERIADLEFPCNLFHGCNVGFWRSTAVAAGCFDERFNGAHGYEDIEFAYRLQRSGCRFSFVDAAVFHLENQVVDVAARRLGRDRNLSLLAELCPDLVAHRVRVASSLP